MAEEVVYVSAYDGLKLQRWPSEEPTAEGGYALDLIRSWGLVVGKAVDEDSAGRSVMAVMPIEEVVDRAVGIARAAFAKLRSEGLMLEIADYEAAREKAREERGRN